MAGSFSYQILGESELFTFDYSLVLIEGEVITSASSQAVVMNGSDPTPNAILIGAPSINGNKVSQRVSGGVNDTTYRLEMTAITSYGNTYIAVGDLPIYDATLV